MPSRAAEILIRIDILLTSSVLYIIYYIIRNLPYTVKSIWPANPRRVATDAQARGHRSCIARHTQLGHSNTTVSQTHVIIHFVAARVSSSSFLCHLFIIKMASKVGRTLSASPEPSYTLIPHIILKILYCKYYTL
jgi:hypothetical protein